MVLFKIPASVAKSVIWAVPSFSFLYLLYVLNERRDPLNKSVYTKDPEGIYRWMSPIDVTYMRIDQLLRAAEKDASINKDELLAAKEALQKHHEVLLKRREHLN